jgi:hypothetical protein
MQHKKVKLQELVNGESEHGVLLYFCIFSDQALEYDFEETTELKDLIEDVEHILREEEKSKELFYQLYSEECPKKLVLWEISKIALKYIQKTKKIEEVSLKNVNLSTFQFKNVRSLQADQKLDIKKFSHISQFLDGEYSKYYIPINYTKRSKFK